MFQQNIIVAKKILAVLEEAGFLALFAGGCVRDRLLGLAANDIDIATSATPEELIELFKSKKIKIIPTGIDHGTVTAVVNSLPIEITTLRRDVEADGRHAKVCFKDTTLRQDAMRRDFTINAMFEDRQGNIYDFFNGQNDLKNKILRFVGHPEARIKEDFLRILRFYRFWGRFDFTPDPASLAATIALRDGLTQISQERVSSELLELLQSQYSWPPLKAMHEGLVLEKILPGHPWPTNLEALFVGCSSFEQKDRGISRLALLINQAKKVKEVSNTAHHLKLSNHEKEVLCRLVAGQPTESDCQETADIMEFVDLCEDHCGDGAFLRLLSKYWMIVATTSEKKIILERMIESEIKKHLIRKAKLPLNGNDVSAATGVTGKPLGDLLKKLKRDFRNEKWRTSEEGLALLKNYF